jgi:hypothetical protein
MNWICPRCSEELGELNGYCEYCKQSNNILVYNPNRYCIRDIRIRHIVEGGCEKMTPQEELFAELFNGYKTKPSVNAMTDLELRAHREELSKIAFEAKAYAHAVDDILKERKPKGPQGFARSVNIDDVSTDAINTIKERQKRMSKADKIQAGLEKLGISTADAAKLMSAGTILGRLKGMKSDKEDKPNEATERSEVEQPKLFNPFEKK